MRNFLAGQRSSIENSISQWRSSNPGRFLSYNRHNIYYKDTRNGEESNIVVEGGNDYTRFSVKFGHRYVPLAMDYDEAVKIPVGTRYFWHHGGRMRVSTPGGPPRTPTEFAIGGKG